jgi:hypothetical protein
VLHEKCLNIAVASATAVINPRKVDAGGVKSLPSKVQRDERNASV